MKAKSIKGNSLATIKTAFEESLKDGFVPTLAIIFISVKQDRKAVVDLLQQNGIEIFGATSSGEFISDHQSEAESAIMLLDINRNDYTLFFKDMRHCNNAEVANDLVATARKKFANPSFIICSTMLAADGRILDGEGLIDAISKKAGSAVNIFGGMAGDDLSFGGTYVFTQGRATDYGLLALIINEDKITFHGMAISGWKPMGIQHKITRSEGNLLYSINDAPALETYLRYLGEDVSAADDQIKFFESVGIHFPFQIERENRTSKMCAPIGYDKEKKALICESDVPQGAMFRFSTPPDFDIIETVVSAAANLKKEVNEEADALLIFSCAGRLSALGPMAQQENEGLSEVWKAPMAGFYTYGEFGRAANGKHEFHSTTNSWVALKEKNNNN